ncbi:enoyl-CoA hydratase/isomerase family protein [Halobacteriales archaeon Cl-PHB]
MPDRLVQTTVTDEIATISLDDPAKKNALSRELAAQLLAQLEEIESRSDVRCVVLTGANDVFCAGGDIEMMLENRSEPVATRIEEGNQTTGKVIWRVAQLGIPTVATLPGPAVGAGANLALACDLQLASEAASLSFGFRNVGVCVDTGTSYFLPRLVGLNTAKELVYTGETVEADQAARLGLVNHVYPADSFEERSRQLIETLASGPTIALRASKRLLNDGHSKSLWEAMEDEAAAQAAPLTSNDHAEGVRAFLEKRDPAFEGS